MPQRIPSHAIRGKRVIITGASSGLGEALAIACARRGMHLGLVARRLDHLERLAERLRDCPMCKGIQIEVAALDVQETDQVLPILAGLADLLGGVDIVIANAGILKARRAGDGKMQHDASMMATNIMGAIATSEAAIHLFRSAGHGGRLAVISSYSALLPLPHAAGYSASKAAVSHYYNAIRGPLQKDGISVTVVHPGFIKTDMVDHLWQRNLPFVSRADDVANETLNAILARKTNPLVPSHLWSWMYRVQRLLPQRVLLALQQKLP